MYTGSLKETILGETYTWSFKSFKKWKKDFLRKYNEEYGRSFKSDVPNSKDRERIYKKLLGFSSEIDVFEKGKNYVSEDIDNELYNNAYRVAEIL